MGSSGATAGLKGLALDRNRGPNVKNAPIAVMPTAASMCFCSRRDALFLVAMSRLVSETQ